MNNNEPLCQNIFLRCWESSAHFFRQIYGLSTSMACKSDSWILLKRFSSRVMAGSPVMAVLDSETPIVDCPDTFRSDPYCRTALGVQKDLVKKPTAIYCQRASIPVTPSCFSKIHESNRNIFMWRSRSYNSCGVEVNAVPDDRMNDTQNDYRNPSCRSRVNDTQNNYRNPPAEG